MCAPPLFAVSVIYSICCVGKGRLSWGSLLEALDMGKRPNQVLKQTDFMVMQTELIFETW